MKTDLILNRLRALIARNNEKTQAEAVENLKHGIENLISDIEFYQSGKEENFFQTVLSYKKKKENDLCGEAGVKNCNYLGKKEQIYLKAIEDLLTDLHLKNK